MIMQSPCFNKTIYLDSSCIISLPSASAMSTCIMTISAMQPTGWGLRFIHDVTCAAAAAAEAIKSEQQRVAAAVAHGGKLAEKEASDRKSAETAAAAAAAARVRRDSQVQAINEKQLEVCRVWSHYVS
jgi:hypothetical protein